MVGVFQTVLRGTAIMFPLLFAAIAVNPKEAPAACGDDAGYHQLDFWLGSWQVFDEEGVLQGANEIEKVLKGCLVVENWHGTASGEGKSWFYYNTHTKRWKQVWITTRAAEPGGMKEKELIETFADGGVRFQGRIHVGTGQTILDRTTLAPLPDGRVRQTIEISRNNGETWEPTFDAYYVRDD